jgi:predicted nicotinamide N-methyase
METAMLLQAPESLRAEASGAAPLFAVREDGTFFRGRRVIRRRATVAGVDIEVATLKDAAELLDDPELLDHFHRTDRLPYGLELWPSALMLAEHLTKDGPGAGREAIELGCGVGFTSIFAAKMGWRIAATDADPLALRFTEFNAKLNEAELESLAFLDWVSPPADRKFTRVLAADVLYQTSDHSPLLNCIQAVLTVDGLAVIADPCRGAAEKFEGRARDAGFDVRHLTTSAQLDGEPPARGQIFELRRA